MIDPRMLMKMVHMSRGAPSREKIIAICVVVAVIAAIIGVERLVGWPDALTINP